MSLLEEFAAQSGNNFNAAIAAATISILLGGILFGTGLGFRIKRIRLIGAEEIGQGIVSAAMIGAIVAFAALLGTITPDLVPKTISGTCSAVSDPTGSPYAYYMCNLDKLNSSYFGLSSSLSRAGDIAGFASSLQVNIGVVSAQPFFAAKAASEELSTASQKAGWISALAYSEFQLADVIRSSALALFLPAGLILRTFFATRKLGAAAMAIAISAYLVYPLLFLHTFTVSKADASANSAATAINEFNAKYASLPLMDLDQTGAVRTEINRMSQGDFGSELQPLFPLSYRALSLALTDLFIYPLIALLISGVAAYELYKSLSAPIFLPYFEAI
ncbi:MAG: hypothetical protein NTV88_04115 [Candidatus Micrarchaeota archaeon]|nr:hypothetical protein [Candidatus Micrarchaeota archaeon]